MTNFAMVHHHKYSLTEIEDMMPWERAIYVNLVSEQVKEENERAKKEQSEMDRIKSQTKVPHR